MEHRVRGATYLLLIIFLLAFLLRALPLREYHGWDESIYLQHAERFAFGKANYDELDFRPPLLSLILAGAFLIKHSIYLADVLVALLAAAITIPLFFIGRKLHSDHAGLLAALLAAVHPAFVTYGSLILTDTIVATFLAAALMCALHRQWLLAGIGVGLGGLTKFTGFGAAPAFALFIVWEQQHWKMRLRSLTEFSIGVAIVILPYLIWLQMRFGLPRFFNRTHEIVNVVHGGPLYYLHPGIYVAPLLGGVILLCIFAAKEYKRMLFLAGVWLLLIIAYLYQFPNREIRYALVAIVPLFALAGTGYAIFIKILGNKWQSLGAIIVVVLIVIFSLNSFSRLHEEPINHWKSPAIEISEYINSLNATGTLYVTSDYPIYGYYTNIPVVVVDGPHFLEYQAQLMPDPGYLTVYKSSEKPPTTEWADTQPHLKRLMEKEDIILYKYR